MTLTAFVIRNTRNTKELGSIVAAVQHTALKQAKIVFEEPYPIVDMLGTPSAREHLQGIIREGERLEAKFNPRD